VCRHKEEEVPLRLIRNEIVRFERMEVKGLGICCAYEEDKYYTEEQGGPTFLLPRAKNSIPFGPKGQETSPDTIFLKTNSQFSSYLTILIQKLLITIILSEI
jgi:hypothetical protein